MLDYARCGWHLAEVDIGYHGQYAVLMTWLCGCPMVEAITPEIARGRDAEENPSAPALPEGCEDVTLQQAGVTYAVVGFPRPSS